METTVALYLTPMEIRALIALCDLACKANGLQCAEAAFVIAKKAEAALTQEPPPHA